MQKLPEVLLFDWDLTLVNTLQSRDAFVHYYQSEYGVELSEEIIKQLFGMTLWHGFNLLYDMIRPNMTREAFHEKMNAVAIDLNSRYDLDTFEVVSELAKTRKLGIISNNNPEVIDIVLKKYPPLFEGLWAGREDKPTKLTHALNHFNIAPQETLYVGDHPGDIESAKAVNMPSVGIVSSLHSAEELQQHSPDFIIQSLDELLEYC